MIVPSKAFHKPARETTNSNRNKLKNPEKYQNYLTWKLNDFGGSEDLSVSSHLGLDDKIPNQLLSPPPGSKALTKDLI